MSLYKRIDAILQDRGMSRRQLAIAAGIPPSTLQSALTREKSMTTEMIQQIAAALEVTVPFLIGYRVEDSSSNPFWWANLESKLKQIGYSTGFHEDDQLGELYIWINYPDGGTLEVRNGELEELHNSTNEYMRFKLEELKKKHAQDFRSGKADRKQ